MRERGKKAETDEVDGGRALVVTPPSEFQEDVVALTVAEEAAREGSLEKEGDGPCSVGVGDELTTTEA